MEELSSLNLENEVVTSEVTTTINDLEKQLYNNNNIIIIIIIIIIKKSHNDVTQISDKQLLTSH
jgi:hypothetical protein